METGVDETALRRKAEAAKAAMHGVYVQQPETILALLDTIDRLRAEKTTLGHDLIKANTLRQQDAERRHAVEQKLRAVQDAAR